MQKWRIVTLGFRVGGRSRGRYATPAEFTLHDGTGGYTYDDGVWDLSIVQGPFSVAPCQTLKSRFATFSSRHRIALSRRGQGLSRARGVRGGSCDREYSMTSSGRCEKCPENAAWSYLQLVAIVLLVLAMCALCFFFFTRYMGYADSAGVVARAIVYVKQNNTEIVDDVGGVFQIVIGAGQVRCVVCTAMKKFAKRNTKVWHGAMKLVLERWTNPKLSRRACSPRYGLHSSAGVA
jgi:hypothetical protein